MGAITRTLANNITTGGVITSSGINNNSLSSVTSLPSGVGGKVLQVVSTTKTSPFTASISASFTDVTGLSATITPASTSNKILVVCTVNWGTSTVYAAMLKLLRGATAISIGDAGGSRTQASTSGMTHTYDNNRGLNAAFSVLDTPSTTSATTYKVQIGIPEVSGGVAQVNTSGTTGDLDQAYIARSASTITLYEIAG